MPTRVPGLHLQGGSRQRSACFACLHFVRDGWASIDGRQWIFLVTLTAYLNTVHRSTAQSRCCAHDLFRVPLRLLPTGVVPRRHHQARCPPTVPVPPLPTNIIPKLSSSGQISVPD